MLLNTPNTVIYSPGICRTGTTSLLEHTILDDYKVTHRNNFDSYVIKNGLYIKNKHLPWEIMNENYLDKVYNNLYMFSLVRNPWSRIFSQWKRDQHSELHPKEDFKNWGDERIKVNFNKFIQRKLNPNSPPLHNNYRWWTNLRWLGGVENIDRYNYIGKFENFNTSLDIILKDIKNLTGLQIETSKLPKVNSQLKRPKEYVKYYSSSSISKVEELYKEDIEYFNYKFAKN